MYNKEQLANLFAEYKYPDFMIDNIVDRLNAMQPEIQILFGRWLENGEIPKDEIEGYTYEELVGDRYRFTPINAFLSLNWLIVNKEDAIVALESGIK